MATAFKRDGSPYYYAFYVDRNGEQIRKSTKTSDKLTAQKIAGEWEALEQQAKSGQATAAQFQKVVNQVAKDVIGETLPNPSVSVYLEEWLETVARRCAAGTHERYRNAVKQFVDAIGPAADQPVRGLTPKHVEQFLNRRLDQGVAPKTVIVDIKSISIALRRAEIYGMIDKNPARAVTLPKNVSSQRGLFAADEVTKLLQAAPTRDWQTLIMLGFYLGARLGDCVAMRWDNVEAEKGLISYEQKKTGRTVTVPMHIHLLRHLHQVSATHAEGFLCPSLANKGSGGKHGLSESFKRIVVRAGLDLMVVEGKGQRKFSKRTFHSLRHSFASALAEHGVPEEVRMRLTGHASRDMHAKYTQMSVEPLKRAITALPSAEK